MEEHAKALEYLKDRLYALEAYIGQLTMVVCQLTTTDGQYLIMEASRDWDVVRKRTDEELLDALKAQTMSDLKEALDS